MEEGYKDDVFAAKFCGLSPGNLRRKRIKGEGPRFYRVGGLIRYKVQDLIDWIESCPTTTAKKPWIAETRKTAAHKRRRNKGAVA